MAEKPQPLDTQPLLDRAQRIAAILEEDPKTAITVMRMGEALALAVDRAGAATAP